jgi:hypothetical protein
MKRFALFCAPLLLGIAWSGQQSAGAHDGGRSSPSVQIAILLDTSNSMDGLIAQAKTQLWNIVNEFVKARKDGRPPLIQVALFEYGKQSLNPDQGFVRLILPLTDDLDRVSEELFKLTTNGGDEYCGWVIKDAVNKLEWSPSSGVYKAIFIAGNEPFTQGPVKFQESCRSAIERGIMVNTIFCGDYATGSQSGWKDGAMLADGRYMSIDQNQKVIEIVTPHDAPIAKLGVELNKTYLPFGRMGVAGFQRQSAQDTNAVNSSQNAIVTRSISKGNPIYNNDAWDLVDAIKNSKIKLEDVKTEDLPEDMKKLDLAARKAKVEAASKLRGEIQSKIDALSKERDKFIAAERRKQTADKDNSLEQAIIKAIREQAARHHFTFE